MTLALPKFGKRSRAGRAVAEIVEDLIRNWGNQLTEPSGRAAAEDA